jgi:opacity protein-like surface antigen
MESVLRKLAAIMAAVAAGCATPAAAQTFAPAGSRDGWYIGGEAGWTHLGTEESHLPTAEDAEAWSDGFAVGARAGYRFGPFRIEEEFRFASSNLERIGLHPSQGSRDAYAFMTNGIYDFSIGLPVSPHIGVGIGAVDLHDGAHVPVLGIASFDNSSSVVFGYQAIAGISYPIAPNVSADLDYRYLATTTPHFTTSPGLVIDGVPQGGKPLSSGYAIHTILASLIWQFDTTP